MARVRYTAGNRVGVMVSDWRQRRTMEGYRISMLVNLFLENNWQRDDKCQDRRKVLQPQEGEMSA